jgi:ribonuclease P protein component
VKLKNRLCQSEEIKRVRATGKVFTHPLLVLIKEENNLGWVRFAVIAGKNIGTAVSRNKAKRRMRVCIDQALPDISGSWDVILQARHGVDQVPFHQVQEAFSVLLNKAEIFELHG